MNRNEWMTGGLLLLLAFAPRGAKSQVYQSYNSETSFFSEAPLENITAINKDGASVINGESGDLVFVIPIRGFRFRKSLMEEHFNENYLESDRYPTAVFKGRILGFDPSRPGIQTVQAEGTLQIHGIDRQVQARGTVENTDGELVLRSTFEVALKDYDIAIPRLVIKNIAEVVEVSLVFYYKPKTK